MNARLFVLLIAGALFGAGLAVSGMTDPARVTSFLDVTGKWDPSLMFVMGGAIPAFGLGLIIFRRRTGGLGWFGARLPASEPDPIDRRLVLGSAIFGIGWGWSGICPGPGIANLAAFHPEALAFVPAMAAGMLIARVGFGADES
ncbi:MAG: hypothetical protein RIQ93_1185 [Verrucomicrobiota bacterium]|jgi:uncharacterized membrane protein YedE/YeeE